MSVIYKYVLTPECSIDMPKGAKILHLGNQNEQICLWVNANQANEPERRHFTIVGTGITFDDESLNYIGTVQLHGREFVFHAFERVKV
ncbi:MAG: hypothetical protein Unbinned6284contig1001_41 [Prokaryotic dsDNA virus sp.]|nr:MAG: hypothetical protein Unbinned6284contig1001_41 [Prokaryotic dsDNA virus sp.]|tara:strand:+ start:9120 stop:9383 length:264 start_codon:yes stop_codon:yes gene_type:complete